MEVLLEFLKQNWIFAIIAVLIIVFLLRAMFKLAIAVLIIGAVLVFGFGFSPSQVFDMGKDVADSATGLYNKTVQPIIEAELGDADYTMNEDGTYVIKTKSTEIRGKKGEDGVTIRYKDKEFKMNLSQLGANVQKQIEDLQSQQ